MLKSIAIAIIGFFIITSLALYSEGIHLPLLAVMLVAFGIGFTNPAKGWMVAIALSFCLLVYGNFFYKLKLEPANPEMLQFFCNMAAFPVLIGGFMGRYFSRIFSSK
jgi:hypothetical protein